MVLVLEDGVEISVHANSVREHLLLVIKKGVGAKILSEIHILVDHGGTAIVGGASAADDVVWEATHVRSKPWREKNAKTASKKAWIF